MERELKNEVHQYRMQHGYPEDEAELIVFAQHFVDWQRERIWHKPDEEPQTERRILWEDENYLGKHLFAGQWKAKRDVFGRKERWCYFSDIRPLSKRND